ncbi:hypothetical protein DFH09DRAFT_1182697 [Mycena vulgaris]|nr:hypothetical protein DFH09DRAFT_1182697 [Mycena vulgaris]
MMYIFSATCLLGVMIMMVGASPIQTPAMPSLVSVSPILSDPPISKHIIPQHEGVGGEDYVDTSDPLPELPDGWF